MKNRTIIGIICIVLALVVTFAVAPLVNKLADSRIDIVRITRDVTRGHMIGENDVEVVSVGAHNLPTNVLVFIGEQQKSTPSRVSKSHDESATIFILRNVSLIVILLC